MDPNQRVAVHRRLSLSRSLMLLSLTTSLIGAAAAQAPTLSKDLTIGCAECGGALQFSNIQEVALTADGRLLVVDRDAPMLRFFDAAGKPSWSAGRKGAGPGEYQYVLRAAVAPTGSLEIVDMAARRLTSLGPDHLVLGTSQLHGFFTTAGTDGLGHLVLGAESPAGQLLVYRAVDGKPVPLELPELPRPETGAVFAGSSVALSRSGVVAIIPHNERYQIIRLDSTGLRMQDITRTIDRVRRTPNEEEALRSRISRQMGAVRAAAEASSGKSGSSAPAPVRKMDLSLKPHLAVDGLRFDGAGRLWARTLRGDDTKTIFDVFAPSGDLLGSVTLEGVVYNFAFAGKWIVTTGEDSDGVPQVTRWTVK